MLFRSDAVVEAAKAAGVAVSKLGRTGGTALTVTGEGTISLSELRDAHEGWLPRFMAAPDGSSPV